MTMSDQAGFTVALRQLTGASQGGDVVEGVVGKVISNVRLEGGKSIVVLFDDGDGISFTDKGQSCCEHRYMSCDDDLAGFVGAKFLGAETRDGGGKEGEYGIKKDCEFLRLRTDAGDIVVANYNEHNGYYGGFWVTAERVAGAEPEGGEE